MFSHAYGYSDASRWDHQLAVAQLPHAAVPSALQRQLSHDARSISSSAVIATTTTTEQVFRSFSNDRSRKW